MRHYMKASILLFIGVITLLSCQTKQWNLNKAIGWKNDQEFSVLYIKWRSPQPPLDSTSLNIKQLLDEKIMKALIASKSGDLAENDSAGESDLHFVVPSDYSRALAIILKVIRDERLNGQVTVFERQYESHNTWKDKVVSRIDN